jgi:flagellar protein FlaG
MNAISIVENFRNKIVKAGDIIRNDKTVPGKHSVEIPRRDELSPDEIKRTVEELNRLSGKFNEKVQFGYYENTNRIVVKIIDKDTNEVVREIPSKYSIRLLEHIQECTGLLVDESR